MSDIVTRLWGNTGKYPGFENLNTEAAAEIERLRADIDSANNALRILYANLKTATTAMERCGLTAMVDGIRADIVTEPCISALSKVVPKEEI